MFQRDPRAGAFLGGDRVSGQDIRDQNGMPCCQIFLSRYAFIDRVIPVLAAQSIANIVKSSLGPLGLDKMLVDNIGVIHSFLMHTFTAAHCQTSFGVLGSDDIE